MFGIEEAEFLHEIKARKGLLLAKAIRSTLHVGRLSQKGAIFTKNIVSLSCII